MDEDKLIKSLEEEVDKLEQAEDLPGITRRMKGNMLLARLFLRTIIRIDMYDSSFAWHFLNFEEDFKEWSSKTRICKRWDHYYDVLTDLENYFYSVVLFPEYNII